MSNGGNAVPGSGLKLGHGEYIPFFRHKSTQWIDFYGTLQQYEFTFSHWNTMSDNSGTSQYANRYLFYNGENIVLYAIWNRRLIR
jgi:hypothetical protein